MTTAGGYRTEYQEWLMREGMKNTVARNYGNWLNNIDKYAIKNGYSSCSVYEIADVATLVKLYERLNEDEDLISNHRDYLTSFRKYILYRSNGTIQLGRFKVQSVSSQDFGTTHIWGEKSNRYIEPDEEDEIIKKIHPELYMKLRSMSKVYDDVNGFKIEWIHSMVGVPVDQEQLRGILDKISWITKVGEDVYSFSRFARAMERDIEFDQESFVRVLMMRYQNGMRFDSIDLENFRETYSDIINEKMELTDEELQICLRKCGVFYKDRIFPAEGIINNGAKEKLLGYIKNSFENGKKVLYYKAIYSDLSDVFAYCFNLTEAMMLKPYLEYICDPEEVYFFDEYISKDRNVRIDHSSEIEELLLLAAKPLSYDEIYAGLSHISKDVIYREIKTNPNIILNEKEHYYYYGIFEFSSEDADQISEFINSDIEDNGYCIWSRVYNKVKAEMPFFIENNIYLSALGIRNAVEKKLSGMFNFDGEVICARGQSLNMSAVYRLYGRHHTPFSDEDVYEFAREVSGGVIYFDSLAEETVRVSKNLFIAKDQIEFDVEAIDKSLSTYLITGYILVKDVDSFLMFPNVGYEWNIFLLESYLMYYSKNYELCNNGQSLSNVAGAVVRKGSGYDDFEDVCADVLANGDIELTKIKALNYLAQLNLLTRRSYNKIEKSITKARQIRNKKE